MSFMKKLFTLPGPRELGMSKYDALQSKSLSPDAQGPTWEDWHAKVKELYPIKYWFLETVRNFITYNVWWKISKPIAKLYHFLVSHIIPSRKYHLLDLRQPYNEDYIDHYRYGWIDVPEKMLYALFNLLGDYLNKESPVDLTEYYSKEHIESDPSLKQQYNNLCEAKAIYMWWTTERKLAYKEYYDLLHQWSSVRKENKTFAEELFVKLTNKESAIEEKTEEMIARLMKIRKSLWT